MTARSSVIHYTGHRIASPSNGGLHPDAETAMARAIADRLDELLPVAAYGSLASGADILCAEACLARGARLHVWLPFAADRFKTLSVRPAGQGWIARFEHALAAADGVTIRAGRGAAETAFASCARAAMKAALSEAMCGRLHVVQLAIWNGTPARGPAGTAADVAAWQSLGLPTSVVNPRPGHSGRGREAFQPGKKKRFP